MNALVVVPVLLPLLGTALCLVVGRFTPARRTFSTCALAAVVTAAAILVYHTDHYGPLVLQAGGHAAPFGITLIFDRLSALLLLVSSVVMLSVLVYAIGQRLTEVGRGVASAAFHPVYLVLCAGVSLAYAAGDLFNLFVAFEMMLAASYVLISRRVTADRLRAGITYVIVSLTSSMLFITMIALVYAATGTVNLAQLSGRVETLPAGLQASLALLMMAVFGIKAAMVPLHFWLPDSYPHAPAPITAVFAGLLTKVGVYSMARTQTLLFAHPASWTVLLVLASLTMLLGALGAIAQDDINRLLSFLLVSHIGFMLFGLGMYTVLGITGLILYMVHHIVVQASLFLVSGLLTRRTGTVSLHEMGGLAYRSPGLAVLFAIPALSLAGMPPFSGFVAKIALLQAGAQLGTPVAYVATGVAVVTSMFSLYVMARVWLTAFWGRPHPVSAEQDEGQGSPRTNRSGVLGPVSMRGATAALVVGGLLVAGAAGPLSGISERASANLLDRDAYRASVLGEESKSAGEGG